MKAVIFGGSGFLGTWLVKKLVENNIKTIIFDKNKTSLKNFVDLNDTNIQFIEGDITNSEQVSDISKMGDVLINLAGLMTPDCSKNPISGVSVNIIGSINVFKAAINQNNKYVIYTSSGGVFGREDPEIPFPETHYGAFKLAVEGIARAFFLENNLSSFGLRPFVIYGPGREVGGTAGITLACKALAKNEDYEIPFSGKAGFVYVEDVAEIIIQLTKKQIVGPNVMNINGVSCKISDMLKIFSNLNNKSKISYKDIKLPIIGEIYGNSPEKYIKDFVYTSLDKGIKYTVDFYKKC